MGTERAANQDQQVRTLLDLAVGVPGAGPVEGLSEAMRLLLASEGRALRQLLPPLLLELSHRGGLAQLEPGLGAELMEMLRRSTHLDMLQERWLERIAARTIARGYSMIVLKGAAFRRTIYDRHAPRSGVDVDVLVRAEERDEVEALLQELGGTRHLPHPGHMATAESLFERIYLMPPPLGPNGEARGPGATIELHDALTKPHAFTIDHAALWEQSLPYEPFAEPLVRRLSAEDSLCFLAVHAFRHGTAPAHSVVDAARLLARLPWSADALVETAGAWGATTVLHAFLRQVAHWTDAPTLTSVLSRTRPGPARRHLLERVWPADRPLLRLEDRGRVRQIALLGLLDRPLAPAKSLAHVVGLRFADGLARRKRN